MGDLSWHILYVRCGKELEVAGGLNIPAYVPHLRRRSFNRRQRRNVVRTSPMFPGLVFARAACPSAIPASQVRAMLGLMRMADGRPAIVNDRDMRALRLYETQKLSEKIQAPVETTKPRSYCVGQEVVVPLENSQGNLLATIEQVFSDKLLVRVLNTHLSLQVSKDALAA